MQFVNRNGLAGARIGVTGQGIEDVDAFTAAIFDDAIDGDAGGGRDGGRPRRGGIPVSPRGRRVPRARSSSSWNDLRKYFATRVGVPMAGKTLADLIAFNEANASIEMPYFAQEIFELAQALEPGADTPQPLFGGLTYNQALDVDHDAGVNGIDKALTTFDLDAIATPTGTPVWTTDLINGDHFEFATSGLAAIVGYPIVNVPMGRVFGAPGRASASSARRSASRH